MSIRKRTWKTSKGEPREAWVVDYVDRGGNRHLKTFERKRDAEAYRVAAGHQIAQGIHTPDSRSIMVAGAAEGWLRSCEAHHLEAATLTSYREHVRLHIEPYLGREKLSQLTGPLVRDFEDRLRTDGRSPAMVRKIHTSLGSLLADAQERGLVARNVARDIRNSRKRGKERQATKRQRGRLKVGVDIPTREEIRAIVDALECRWRPLILTAIFTGLRASELRGLRWSDIDFMRGELHVRQRADRYNVIGPPKSAHGERVVPLTPMLANTLRQWKLACSANELDLVFPASGGGIESYHRIRRLGLIPAQQRARLEPRYGLHSLRHFYASWCINRRIDGGLELPAKLVQERLGHSSITMTMDVYGHLFPRGDDAADLAQAEKSLLG